MAAHVEWQGCDCARALTLQGRQWCRSRCGRRGCIGNSGIGGLPDRSVHRFRPARVCAGRSSSAGSRSFCPASARRFSAAQGAGADRNTGRAAWSGKREHDDRDGLGPRAFFAFALRIRTRANDYPVRCRSQSAMPRISLFSNTDARRSFVRRTATSTITRAKSSDRITWLGNNIRNTG